MTACHGAQRRGQGEGQHEVGHRQQQVALLFEPLLRLLILALGAMPIATRMILIEVLITIRTMIDVPAQRFSPTVFNGPHRLPMAGQQPVTKPGAIRGATLRVPEDFGQLYHGRSAITRLIAAMARCSVGWVR